MSSPERSRPTWEEFADRPALGLELPAPAAELAAVLQRFRDDLDEAARASAANRMLGLRALAEQAILAVELERVIQRHAVARDHRLDETVYQTLDELKDRMLAQIASSGLEVIRLRGTRAGEIRDLAAIDCWRYDELEPDPIVVEEIEAAVRLDGTTIRQGRVVVSGPRGASTDSRTATPDLHSPDCDLIRAGEAGPPVALAPRGRIICPIATCRAENPAAAEACVCCLTPLAGFARLSMRREELFNGGLAAARAGDTATARDCFAAIVLWHPQDIDTRNAHALACLEAGDVPAARLAWEHVLTRAPDDTLALRGLAALPRDVVASTFRRAPGESQTMTRESASPTA